MLRKINGTDEYLLDTEKECIVKVENKFIIPKEKIEILSTKLYGKETKKNYNWYKTYTDLDINLYKDLVIDTQKWVNLITIRNCYSNGNLYTTRTLIQTPAPMIIKHENIEYAVLFRFGYLAISKDGSILDLNTKIINNNIWFRGSVPTKETYYYYKLTNNDHLVHRLILEAWLYNEEPSLKYQVNHIDGNKANNTLDNLEWVTPSENIRHLFQTGLSNQNIVARIRHRLTKEIKEFYSKSEMCRFLGITEQSFINTPLGYLYSDYEIRVSTDKREWYYLKGDEPIIPKTATQMFKVYKNKQLYRTLFLRDDLNLMFNLPRLNQVTNSIQYINKTRPEYHVDIISLVKSGPYDVKNLETDEVKRFDNIPQISSYIGYNESSIRVSIDTDKIVNGKYAIKSAENNWQEVYNAIGATIPKKVSVRNIITGVVTICETQREAYELVKTTKKTLKKHMNTGKSFNNYIINSL